MDLFNRMLTIFSKKEKCHAEKAPSFNELEGYTYMFMLYNRQTQYYMYPMCFPTLTDARKSYQGSILSCDDIKDYNVVLCGYFQGTTGALQLVKNRIFFKLENEE